MWNTTHSLTLTQKKHTYWDGVRGNEKTKTNDKQIKKVLWLKRKCKFIIKTVWDWFYYHTIIVID